MGLKLTNTQIHVEVICMNQCGPTTGWHYLFGFGVLQGEGINDAKDGMKLEQFVSLVGSEREV